MDSNYPLVRLTDASGNVYYARTYNWSSTSVMTGGRPVSTEFTLPAAVNQGGGATYSLVVVANGISSDPMLFPAPGLTIRRTTTNTVAVSWPSPSTGFVLQQNGNLSPTSWVNSSQTPATRCCKNRRTSNRDGPNGNRGEVLAVAAARN